MLLHARKKYNVFRPLHFELDHRPINGDGLQTTRRIEPRVIATYTFFASNISEFKSTATSASSPLRSSVLPTARRGRGRPTRRFSSRTRIQHSSSGLPLGDAARRALSA